MKRRQFVKKSLLTGVAATAVTPVLLSTATTTKASNINQLFKMDFAPHDGMFKHSAGASILDQIKFMHDQGFTAFEDNEMGNRSVSEQEAIGNLLDKLNMRMGVFVAHKIYWKAPNLTSGDKTYQKEFLDNIKNAVAIAKRTNAKWMTVVPGFQDLRLDLEYQTAHVVESLKLACSILEPHQLTMVLEPLNFYNHPGMFLSRSPQAYQICKAVNSPSCKILFDIYHQQIQEGNLLPNIDKCWKEIAYFQIGDNPGRNEPTTGEINYKNVFKHIYNKGYKGILGMEHGNSKSNKSGELAVINAYKEVTSF